MSYGTNPGRAAQRTITAFFDSRTDADEAVARLKQAGIAQENVRVIAQESDATAAAGESTEGFWESLRDLFMPEEDRQTYAEGLRRGGYLVTVHTTDEQYEPALDILDDEGTIDIEERAQSWRSEGWTGPSASADTMGRTGTTSAAGLTGATGGRTGSMATGGTSQATTGSDRDTEVIPVAEEELHVGKRDVSHGRVRVRSYVVERPVEEQVSLREERVSVERRPVEGSMRSGAASGDELFRERTVELDETSEEAVVSKEARVKEELVVKKNVEQRTETVSDTVRRTEVDVEDERGARSKDPKTQIR